MCLARLRTSSSTHKQVVPKKHNLFCLAHRGVAHAEPFAGAFVGGGVDGHGAPVLVHDGTSADRPVDGEGHGTANRGCAALGAVEARLAVPLIR